MFLPRLVWEDPSLRDITPVGAAWRRFVDKWGIVHRCEKYERRAREIFEAEVLRRRQASAPGAELDTDCNPNLG